jgi:hypothetical protein
MTEQPSEEPRLAAPVPLRQRRAAARAKELADLMERRPDLAGVYLPADLTAEAIRWSA